MWKMIFLCKWMIFRFHVNFAGCKYFFQFSRKGKTCCIIYVLGQGSLDRIVGDPAGPHKTSPQPKQCNWHIHTYPQKCHHFNPDAPFSTMFSIIITFDDFHCSHFILAIQLAVGNDLFAQCTSFLFEGTRGSNVFAGGKPRSTLYTHPTRINSSSQASRHLGRS